MTRPATARHCRASPARRTKDRSLAPRRRTGSGHRFQYRAAVRPAGRRRFSHRRSGAARSSTRRCRCVPRPAESEVDRVQLDHRRRVQRQHRQLGDGFDAFGWQVDVEFEANVLHVEGLVGMKMRSSARTGPVSSRVSASRAARCMRDPLFVA